MNTQEWGSHKGLMPYRNAVGNWGTPDLLPKTFNCCGMMNASGGFYNATGPSDAEQILALGAPTENKVATTAATTEKPCSCNSKPNWQKALPVVGVVSLALIAGTLVFNAMVKPQ